MEKGPALLTPAYPVSLNTFLSKAAIGPVMGRYCYDVLRHSDWLCSKYTGQHCINRNLILHILIQDRQFEDARKALLAEGHVGNRSHMFDGPISGLPATKCV